MVTNENYEEYMMLDADGELDSKDKEALLAFIAANPALKEEFDAWQSLKLQPDVTQAYPDKEGLLKSEAKWRVLSFRPYLLAAAAAALALVILIPALRERRGEHPSIVHAIQEAPAVPVKDIYPDTVERTPPARKEKPQRNQRPGSAPARTRLAVHHELRPPVLRIENPDSVAPLLAIASTPVRVAVQVPSPAPETAPELAAEAPGNESPRQPLISWAPENRQAFQQLKAAFEAQVSKASAAAKTVKETTVVIRLGNSSLNLNF